MSMGPPKPNGGLFLSPKWKGGERAEKISYIELLGELSGANHFALN